VSGYSSSLLKISSIFEIVPYGVSVCTVTGHWVGKTLKPYQELKLQHLFAEAIGQSEWEKTLNPIRD
jgi:hypothetical protein